VKTIKYMVICVVLTALSGCQEGWGSGPHTYEPDRATGKVLTDLYGTPEGGHVNIESVGSTNIATTMHTTTNVGADKDPDVSADGKWLLFSSTRGSRTNDIYMKQLGTSVVTQLTSHSKDDIMPKFSADGRSVVFSSNRHGNKFDIYILPLFDRNGKRIQAKPIQITSNDRHNISPCFNPTGDKIVYSSMNFRSQSWELWIYSHNERTHSQIGYGLLPEWSPNGKQIVYEKYRNRGKRYSTIWICNEDGSSPSEIVGDKNYGAITPTWSPDGKYIAYATVHKSEYALKNNRFKRGDNIWYVPVLGGNMVQVTNHNAPDAMPVWRLDHNGKAVIFFISAREKGDRIWSAEPYTVGDLDGFNPD
jgi:Tol biopolymer transport system component